MNETEGRDTVRIAEVGETDRELLWNINQKYLYEMTNYYPDELDERGNLHYGHFGEYFKDPERKAFFIYEGGTLAGFAMINPYSYINGDPDYVLAEFTVFPSYRGRRIATRAVGLIFDRFEGRWEIKYNEKNKPAANLWNKVTERFRPEKTRLNESETVLSFDSGYNGTRKDTV